MVSSDEDIETADLETAINGYVNDNPEEASELSSSDDKEIVLEYTLTRILRVKSKPVVEVVTDFTKPKTKGAKK